MCVIIKTIYDFKEKAMKNLIKIITLIICFSFIVSPLAACEKQSVETNAPTQAQTEGMTEEKKTEAPTTAPTETQTEVITTEEATTVEETEPVETELSEDIVSFIDYTRASSRGLHNLKTGGDMAISFTIPEGQLKSIYLTLTDKNGYNDVSYEINVYAFNGKYDESVATEPLCNQVVTSSMRTFEIAFEDGEMGPGSYLVVASYYEDENTPEDAYCSIIRDIFWNNKTEPEGYKDYVLRSYIDGDVTKPFEALCNLINEVQSLVGYDEELVAFVDNYMFAAFQNSTEISKLIAVSDFKQGDISIKVKSINGVAIIPVASERMKTAYEFGDNGFKPAPKSREIYMLVAPKNAAHLVKKTENMRIFTPEQNVDADAYKFDYRIYYDVFVNKNGLDAIWAWVSPVVSITKNLEDTTVTAGSITGSLGVTATSTATLTYQWYECANENGAGAVKIAGANTATMKIPTTLEKGKYYYFVKVIADGVAGINSDVATVTVS
jgi:hypothetical protein